jgi:uncharacterized protein
MYGDTVAVPANEMKRFCQRWKVQELALFGSVLREDFDATSDVDVLVTFTDDAKWSLLDHVQMENELAEMVGRNVDLISKRALEKSQNWIRREAILETAQVLFSR